MNWIWLWPLGLSVAAFAAMARDKYQAVRGGYRIQETTLLSLAILGGGPGALLAMLLLRHKTRKPAFFLGIPAIVLVQGAIVGFLRTV